MAFNGYELSRQWFDFAFANPEKISPNHAALYFFTIEHCNRLGWKEKFGLPTTMAKEAIGIKSYNTYINTLTDLIEWGFIKMIQKSTNQYSANIVALSNFNKALDKADNNGVSNNDKALDKAMIKHVTKHRGERHQSTGESISSIDKQYNQLTKEQITERAEAEFRAKTFEKQTWLEQTAMNTRAPIEKIIEFCKDWFNTAQMQLRFETEPVNKLIIYMVNDLKNPKEKNIAPKKEITTSNRIPSRTGKPGEFVHPDGYDYHYYKTLPDSKEKDEFLEEEMRRVEGEKKVKEK